MEVQESNEEESTCTIDRVVGYIKDLKCVRAFGLFLKVDQGKLNEILEQSDKRLTKLIVEWFAADVRDRWEMLCRALLQPAVCEPAVAYKIKRYLRRGSSVDSAISDISVSSPISPSSLYQMSFVGEFTAFGVACMWIY